MSYIIEYIETWMGREEVAMSWTVMASGNLSEIHSVPANCWTMGTGWPAFPNSSEEPEIWNFVGKYPIFKALTPN